MKISDNTSISMPIRNLIAIIGAVALGTMAYFGVIERLNKIETKDQITHKPSGIQITCSETRSQLDNKVRAMQMLKSQLYEIELKKKNEKRNEIESSKKKIEWGSQIRNYVLHPYKLVKDLRTGTETGNTDSVLNGNIKDFLKSYLMFNTNQSNENLSQS